MGLASGKSIRWVAEQLGHSNPELTLRTYSHVMRAEEPDLSFADFSGPKRPDTAPPQSAADSSGDDWSLTIEDYKGILERETGIELATLTLAREDEPEQDQGDSE